MVCGIGKPEPNDDCDTYGPGSLDCGTPVADHEPMVAYIEQTPLNASDYEANDGCTDERLNAPLKLARFR